jgi:hypothetical protein
MTPCRRGETAVGTAMGAAIRDSLVKKVSKVGVRNRIEDP